MFHLQLTHQTGLMNINGGLELVCVYGLKVTLFDHETNC